jgi:hypothetical protein
MDLLEFKKGQSNFSFSHEALYIEFYDTPGDMPSSRYLNPAERDEALVQIGRKYQGRIHERVKPVKRRAPGKSRFSFLRGLFLLKIRFERNVSVLTQEEIDELLAIISSGEVEASPEENKKPSALQEGPLSQEEIDKLLADIESDCPDSDFIEPSPAKDIKPSLLKKIISRIRRYWYCGKTGKWKLIIRIKNAEYKIYLFGIEINKPGALYKIRLSGIEIERTNEGLSASEFFKIRAAEQNKSGFGHF